MSTEGLAGEADSGDGAAGEEGAEEVAGGAGSRRSTTASHCFAALSRSFARCSSGLSRGEPGGVSDRPELVPAWPAAVMMRCRICGMMSQSIVPCLTRCSIVLCAIAGTGVRQYYGAQRSRAHPPERARR